MCGIAGVSCRERMRAGDLRDAVARMVRAMHHRGPDDSGYVAVAGDPGAVVLANTRLAIVDLSSAGHQPMNDPETGNWLAFNGEIYNHLEVRQALGPVRWHSSSDTETILQAYAAWGTACVERFRGMFAIALYDAARQTLWCVRDRLGIKPLYFATGPERFVFASEVRPLVISGLAEDKIDPHGLAAYMRFGSLIEPYTLLQDVRSLPAGHCLEVQDGAITKEYPYWSLCGDATPPALPAGDIAETTRALLESSVREHMLADVPVGCFLSGGIDSSTLAALAASVGSTPLRTFTVAFHDTAIDESQYARTIAARFGTEHTEVRLSDKEVAARVPEAVAAMDLPSVDGINTYIVSRAVRVNGLKVVLSGLGGDEVFGGYRSFRLLPFATAWSKVFGHIPPYLAALLPGGERAREMMQPDISLPERYSALRALWSRTDLTGMGLDVSPELFQEPGPDRALRTRVSALELSGYMRNVLLRDSDVMSMAHSIELRVPFLDHRLVEHVLRYDLAGPGRKTHLLDAVGDLLPRRHKRRPKQGFWLPMDVWLRGSLREFAEAGLAVLDKDALMSSSTLAYKEAFYSGRLSWPRLWQLVVLGHWLARFAADRAQQPGVGIGIAR